MRSDAEQYFRRDPERDEFYSIFYRVCRQYGVVWSSASAEARAFVEEVTRITYERNKAKKEGRPLSSIRAAFDSAYLEAI